MRGHQREFADGHDDRTDDDALALTEPTVGNYAADYGCQVNERGVVAVDEGRQRLGIEGYAAVENDLVEMFERVIADQAFGCGRQQKVVGEGQDEQGAHPVIGKALPHFGGEEIAQPDRMAE